MGATSRPPAGPSPISLQDHTGPSTPGWYLDPDDHWYENYWTGSEWSGHWRVTPLPVAQLRPGWPFAAVIVSTFCLIAGIVTALVNLPVGAVMAATATVGIVGAVWWFWVAWETRQPPKPLRGR